MARFIETENRIEAARGWGEDGKGKFLFNGYRVSILQDKKSSGDDFAQYERI